ncbi:hypothetical protein PR001_g31615, partial [Phytophthora rubi]
MALATAWPSQRPSAVCVAVQSPGPAIAHLVTSWWSLTSAIVPAPSSRFYHAISSMNDSPLASAWVGGRDDDQSPRDFGKPSRAVAVRPLLCGLGSGVRCGVC